MEYIQYLGSKLTGGRSFAPEEGIVLLVVAAALAVVIVDWIRSSRKY